MKKCIVALVAMGLAAFANAGAEDVLLTFSTVGPDKYADGTVVLDNECYALVWIKAGSEFGGISADGKAISADNKVVLTIPAAKGGRCPAALYQIDSATADALAGGTYQVYLLDTRVSATEVSGLDDDGTAKQVNDFGIVSGVEYTANKAGVDGVVVKKSEDGATAADTAAAIEAGAVPQPKIVGFKVVDGKAVITVADTVPYLIYNVAADTKPAISVADGFAAPVAGKADGTIEFTVDASKGSFFKIIRNPVK